VHAFAVDRTGTLPPLLRIPAVATTLDCSERHVRELIAKGKLRALKVGGLTRVEQEEVLRFIEVHRIAKGQE
jgi:excisionase family DNA binding protein